MSTALLAPDTLERPVLQTAPALAPAAEREGLRIPGLDGLRGLAVLLLFYAHFTGHEPTRIQVTLPELLYFRSSRIGWWALDIFFVLSGFLITGILYDAKGKAHYFRDFYMRRTLRIFPLYYGVLLFTLVASLCYRPLHRPGSEATAHSMLWLWCYASNIGMCICQTPTGLLDFSDWLRFDHFWSLALEEHFYLVWPFVVFFLERRSLMKVCVGVIIFALALRVWFVLAGYHFSMIWWFTPARLDEIAVGALLALGMRGRSKSRWLRAAPWLVVLTAPVLGSIIFNYCYSRFGRFERLPHFTECTVGNTAVAFFFGGVLLLAVHARPSGIAARFWNCTTLRFLGKYSYGIYVFHGVMAYFLYSSTAQVLRGLRSLRPHLPFLTTSLLTSPTFRSLLHTFVAGTISIAAAWVAYHLYEKHFLKLKKYFA